MIKLSKKGNITKTLVEIIGAVILLYVLWTVIKVLWL